MPGTAFPTAAAGSEPPLQDEAEAVSSRFGLRSYYALCLLVDGSISALAVGVWSNSLGVGASTYAALEDFAWLSKWCFGMCFLVLLGLYLLDFFWPPHLPGQILLLWEGDTCLGRMVLCSAGLFLMLALLLLTPVFPSLPIVLTITLCPVCVGILRMTVGPGEGLPKGRRMNEIVEEGDDESKVQLLMSILGQENDTLSFFKAATAAFLTSCSVTLMLWVIYGVVLKRGLEQLEDAEEGQRDKVYLQWATPLVVSVSNLVFALFSVLRVFMQQTYIATDACRNKLLAETLRSSVVSADLRGWRLAAFTKVDCENDDSHRDLYLTRHTQNVKQLSLLVKAVGCAFVLLIGLLYVVSQLIYANSDIAFMVLALSAALFVLFILFVWVAFSRIVWAIGKWLHELPVWRTAASVTRWSLTRAFFICPLLPVVPLLLLASVLNQRVRCWRQLHPKQLVRGRLTPRVAAAVESMRRWDRLAICTWCYLLCAMYVCYTICPLLLNVSLSWLRNASADWPFAVIVALTFVLGVVLFLLPPVPGMTVYIFGGLVISGTCPPAGTVRGFWTGTAVNIGMCWALKLAACAVQQKCIGGLLGRSQWVRRTVGVHRVAIRCVEAELKVPGLTVGKVAILCGGPDWPTSVLAGVLGLSLWQCEIGTMPIIGFVAPCAMTGSLYIKQGEGDVWVRSAHLMIVASVVVNLLLWGLAFWAIQNRMEADYEELSQRLPENVDLHWQDHRDEHVAKHARVPWAEMPALVRRLYMLGAVLHIFACHVLNWAYSWLFGYFAVQDDINTLVFWPRADSDGNELFTSTSLVVLACYMLALAFPLQFLLWHRLCVTPVQRRVAKEMDTVESEWKVAFLYELEHGRSSGRVESTSTLSCSSTDSNSNASYDSLFQLSSKEGKPLPEAKEEGATLAKVMPLPQDDSMPLAKVTALSKDESKPLAKVKEEGATVAKVIPLPNDDGMPPAKVTALAKDDSKPLTKAKEEGATLARVIPLPKDDGMPLAKVTALSQDESKPLAKALPLEEEQEEEGKPYLLMPVVMPVAPDPSILGEDCEGSQLEMYR